MMKTLLSRAFLLPLFTFGANSLANQQDRLTIVSYNVENLFDTDHDKGKKDGEFLPKDHKDKKDACVGSRNVKDCLKTDWTEKRLKIKLENTAWVLKQIKSDLPDIAVFAEVENKSVLTKLAEEAGYNKEDLCIGESPDERGIDVALIYKKSPELEMKKCEVNNVVKLDGDDHTRNILEVHFRVPGKADLVILGNHWPSLGNKTPTRIKAAKTMADVVDRLVKANPQNPPMILAMGDFNTIPEDKDPESPLDSITKGKNALNDVYPLAVKAMKPADAAKLPKGTYYYPTDAQWNMLDHFFASENLLSSQASLTLDKASFQIFRDKEDLMSKKWEIREKNTNRVLDVIKIPRKYFHDKDTNAAAGYSDHYPIVIDLKIN